MKAAVRVDGRENNRGLGRVQMAKVVADILRLIAELRLPPVTSTA
jgi:hypothetical protein